MSQPGEKEPPSSESPVEPETADSRRVPHVVPFQSLADGREEVWIELGEQIYRLRRTRQGKLILTK